MVGRYHDKLTGLGNSALRARGGGELFLQAERLFAPIPALGAHGAGCLVQSMWWRRAYATASAVSPGKMGASPQ